MKRVGYLKERICDPDNLRLAFLNARKGKRGKLPVMRYEEYLDENLFDLRRRLLDGTFAPGRYNYFRIFEPKERLICAAVFEERIVHHAIMNVCKPYFERHLIYDTYATRNGKGVYAAIEQARQGMRSCGYVAKLDVRKYFDSIKHDVLKTKLRRLFKDNWLLSLFDRIIDSYCTSPGRGIPIGNLTSQYFANYYLSSLDHKVKEKLRVPVYVRYMDDMLLFSHDRIVLRDYVGQVVEFVKECLSLELKPVVFSATNHGVSFLGYRLARHVMLLNRRGKVRFKRKFMRYAKMFNDEKMSENEYLNHVLPLLAFVEKAYTRRLRSSVITQSMVTGKRV